MAANYDRDEEEGGTGATSPSVISGSGRLFALGIAALIFELLVTVPAVAGDCYLLMSGEGPKIYDDFVLGPRTFLHCLMFYVLIAILVSNAAVTGHWVLRITRWFRRRHPTTRKVLVWIFAIVMITAAGAYGFYERDLLIQRFATTA